MSVSKAFVAYAVDLLQLAGPVRTRAMFGGVGLYKGETMFGLLDDDELFLKADDLNRQTFVDAGCRQWTYPSPKGPMPTSYYRPPDAALDDPESMLPWARLAQDAAARALAMKLAKKRKPAPSAARSKARPNARAKP